MKGTGNPPGLRAVWRWLPAAGALVVLGGIAVLQRDVASWWALAGVGCAVAYAGRESWPAAALALSLLVVAATRLPGAGVLSSQIDVVYLLLLFIPTLPLVALASRVPPRRSWLGLVATAVVTIAVCPDPAWSATASSAPAQAIAWALGVGVPATLALAAWLAGSALLAREQYAEALLERSDALERTRAVEAARAVADERARIARDVHDVVTHTVAVMVVQASAAGAVWDRDPEQARAALRAVEDSGRTVMADLRAMLGAMRDEAPLEAMPGVEALPVLVEQVRRTGVTARLSVEGPVEEIAATTGLSLLRIAQESVTNALRHAQPSSIEIDLAVAEGTVCLSIADDGVGVESSRRDALDPGGHGGTGILGMRERARVFGGRLDVRPGTRGGTLVTVRAPLGAGS